MRPRAEAGRRRHNRGAAQATVEALGEKRTVWIEAECVSEARAKQLLSFLEDTVGKHDADLIDSGIEESF